MKRLRFNFSVIAFLSLTAFLMSLLVVGQAYSIRPKSQTTEEIVYLPDDEVLLMMSYPRARQLIESMENRSVPIPGLAAPFIIKNIVITSEKVTWRKECADLWYVSTSYLNSMKIVAKEDRGEYVVNLGNVKAQGRGGGLKETPFDGDPFWRFAKKDEAISLAKAFYVIKRYAEGYTSAPQDDPVAEAAFSNEARRYRELPAKPALPADVQRCRVMAEEAVKNKDFEKALDYYRKGLAVEPLWPQGQFNAAMLEGELQLYRWAAFHMKHYLELVPDAKNAEAVREKIYLWEGKANEEMQKAAGVDR